MTKQITYTDIQRSPLVFSHCLKRFEQMAKEERHYEFEEFLEDIRSCDCFSDGTLATIASARKLYYLMSQEASEQLIEEIEADDRYQRSISRSMFEAISCLHSSKATR